MRETRVSDVYRYLRVYVDYVSLYKINKYGFKFKGNKKMKNGIFEPEVSQYLIEQFKSKNNLFIDVGAHQGYYSCLANANNVKKVYAIEPDNLNRTFLKLNLKKNGFSKNSQILKVAVGSKSGQIKLFGFGTGNSAIPNWSGNVSRRVKSSQAQTLDSILSNELPLKNSLVKIDVEGFELEVIRGATKTIADAKNTNFLVELSLQRDNNNVPLTGEVEKIVEILDFFNKNNYEIFSINPNNANKPLLTQIPPKTVFGDLNKYGSGNYIFEKIKE